MSTRSWDVKLTQSALRDLRRLDPQIRRRVTAALEALAANPQRPGALRKLSGAPEHRLRIGDWRALLLLDARVLRATQADHQRLI